ncbi:hypothetical protein EH183_10125 [Streptomyces sp. CB01881]|uniref:hypothetical protein n=1 Tax=Streptomyces sp. CB01881 TaxID=2078691 RepID=UPI0013875E6E|nr:hypothetical protein [Streptomyces sp. CB01881]TYC72631.1 hypothetical protein EH183_10125 [Streptomyces sp. CB01881]
MVDVVLDEVGFGGPGQEEGVVALAAGLAVGGCQRGIEVAQGPARIAQVEGARSGEVLQLAAVEPVGPRRVVVVRTAVEGFVGVAQLFV